MDCMELVERVEERLYDIHMSDYEISLLLRGSIQDNRDLRYISKALMPLRFQLIPGAGDN